MELSTFVSVLLYSTCCIYQDISKLHCSYIMLMRWTFHCREYVKEVKGRLISFLSSCPLCSQHTKEFFSMLLDEYQALCNAADVLRPFFLQLVRPPCFTASLQVTVLDLGEFYSLDLMHLSVFF